MDCSIGNHCNIHVKSLYMIIKSANFCALGRKWRILVEWVRNLTCDRGSDIMTKCLIDMTL